MATITAHSNRSRFASAGIGVAVLAAIVALGGCTVTHDKSDGRANVEIKTPVGGVSINNTPSPQDVGLAIYPGARPRTGEGNENEAANVNVSSNVFGLKVAALRYVSDDPPQKVADFYRKEMARYGHLRECPGRNMWPRAGSARPLEVLKSALTVAAKREAAFWN